MQRKILIGLGIVLFSIGFLSAQFMVRDDIFTVNSVSNQGKVAGYAAQAGPYSLWLPDSGNVVLSIGGLAPGNGVGGQAYFSADGNFLSGTSAGTIAPELSRYNRTTNQWTTLGSLGFAVDNTLSGGFGISGDGNTIVGNSWADTTGGVAYTHAVAWNMTEGLMDLGSIFSDSAKSTRANAVSHDGSVVVGWQDFNGPWKSAVWRKNPAGGYFPNQYLLIDPTGNPLDEFNQLGECSTVSGDGNWIGGYGDYANNYQPWIWSQDSGVINLGTFPNVGNGYVSGMSADGAIVVGWFDGMLFGDPFTPFIWTKSGGLQELNHYVHTVLGDSTYSHQLYSAQSISPDGHYVAGFGVDNVNFVYFVYRITLNGTTDIPKLSTMQLSPFYPNPTTGNITLENARGSRLTIRSMDGKLIKEIENLQNDEINLAELLPGMYALTLQKGNKIQTQKLIKK